MDREVSTAQTKLISATLGAVGMNVSEADLAIEAYASAGFIARDNLYLESLHAQVRTADALEKSLGRLITNRFAPRSILPAAHRNLSTPPLLHPIDLGDCSRRCSVDIVSTALASTTSIGLVGDMRRSDHTELGFTMLLFAC